MYCRGTDIGLLVADVSNPLTVEHLARWRDQLIEVSGEVPTIVALNKCDLAPEANVDAYGAQLDAHEAVMLVSAVSGFNIDALFERIGKLAFDRSKRSPSVALVPAVPSSRKRC
jgi:50S ribosomal subunit-associated GTPase HflX